MVTEFNRDNGFQFRPPEVTEIGTWRPKAPKFKRYLLKSSSVVSFPWFSGAANTPMRPKMRLNNRKYQQL